MGTDEVLIGCGVVELGCHPLEAEMQWEEIRKRYPDQWLLLEALEAHSRAGQRVLERLAVLGSFADSASAMRAYGKQHREATERELYVFHTSREVLDVRERVWLGVRIA